MEHMNIEYRCEKSSFERHCANLNVHFSVHLFEVGMEINSGEQFEMLPRHNVALDLRMR